ncbi:transmembrane and coiled-coil domain-containing protein [Thalictrum thalictroides]|uniref:Transmembrane and coiled-coil domain-containing protein n=1 Tax=Thalictrum thalictroides TaxID=46969 RepID=A0A7J6VLB7_THATH|nr:transmembrane and coiled-coil domain-containing protein [Thalictrum thalictroides]
MSILTSTQRYAAGGLFALALHQAQIHQTHLGSSVLPTDEHHCKETNVSNDDDVVRNCDSVTQDSKLWIHNNSGLLHSIFRFLEIDSIAWCGLQETAGTSSAKEHIGAFFRLLSEDTNENSSERIDKEVALMKAVDAMAMSMKTEPVASDSEKERESKYEDECREKLSLDKIQSTFEVKDVPSDTNYKISSEGEALNESGTKFNEEMIEEVTLLNYQTKVVVLYELLSACLADISEDDKNSSRHRKGYDARHRVALRLLATWLDVEWMKMEAMEVMVACSVMALLKNEEEKGNEIKSSESTWASWKRGGIIGAAALTGGTLMAVTGGLAAPAIAAGFGALAPTLGTLIPVIGASGFAAAASAAGSVAGSIAVAASFGAAGAGLTGTKMARRIGDIDEFEFKAIGENHNQGRLAVGILVSGLVFEEEDFIRPWEGQDYNLERYALQWESEILIAVSTAIQDWLTSSKCLESQFSHLKHPARTLLFVLLTLLPAGSASAAEVALGLMKQGAMMTVLGTLVSALAFPAALLTATDFIDSKWAIAVDRSDKAGKLLAEVLSKGLQGNRPVTLVGYSLGARVIFECLQCLAETESNAGLVERVVLLGAPVPFVDEKWKTARKMVAGRFVNVFSTNDWTLGVAFRASLLSQGLAGIQPVDVPGIENVNVTELIEGHSSYLCTTHQILEQLQLDAFYPIFKGPRAKFQEGKNHQT